MYSNALVIGKFHNLHQGHIALIQYAKTIAKEVTVLLTVEKDDPIHGGIRMNWLQEEIPHLAISVIQPSAVGLSNKSESDKQVSKEWAEWIHKHMPHIDVCVGSEEYINYMADEGYFAGEIFDIDRLSNPYSSTSVREGDFKGYCFAAKKDLVKVVAFIGPESCGKSVAADSLKTKHNCAMIPELARNIFTNEAYYSSHELVEVALATQLELQTQIKNAESPLTIMDSSTLTTKIYYEGAFNTPNTVIDGLFKTEPVDHYFLFTPEAEFVQDGTRTQSQSEREIWYKTAKYYLDALKKPYTVINGSDWDQRQKDVDNVLTTL